MLAKEHRVPVVACVETYKFGERVVLDGVASNELGDPEIMLSIPGRKRSGTIEAELKSLTRMSLMYDLTPPNLITAVCTEVRVAPSSLPRLLHFFPNFQADLFFAKIGFIPPSSVPTVLGKASGVI